FGVVFDFQKIENFLQRRGCIHLLENFIVNKIDDTVAPFCDDKKLLDLGLLYGDLISFKQTFCESSSKVTTYREKAQNLKTKLKRTHTERLSSTKRPVTIKPNLAVNLGIKCLERNKYVHKSNKNACLNISRSATYRQVLVWEQNHKIAILLNPEGEWGCYT
uniref:Uncharacterized protein n=1 Tax=Clytia hemisphaerica TaxID=252671 RepID=A0A7M5X188_9CNID